MKYVTEKDLVRMLKVSPRFVLSLRRRRLIPFCKLGRSVRFPLEEVESALKKLTVKELG